MKQRDRNGCSPSLPAAATEAAPRLLAADGADPNADSARAIRAFRLNRDQNFLWLGEPHRAVLDALYGAVLGGSSLVILTGEIGAGKTMLADAVAARLAEGGGIVGRIVYPSRDPDDFWNAVVGAFGLPTDGQGRDAALAHFAGLVHRARLTSRPVLLVIDEAQVLTNEVLAEVGRVCDAAREAAGPGLLTVLLVGQDELDVLLARAEVADLGARIGMRRRLAALSDSDVALYIRHRLACAGASSGVFPPDALRAIAANSRGIPRLVNSLCTRALAIGGGFDAKTVARAARELACPADDRRRRQRLHSTSLGRVLSPARGRRLGIGITAVLASAGVLALAVSRGGDSRPPLRSGPPVSATATMWSIESARPAAATTATPPLPDVLSDLLRGRPAASPDAGPPSAAAQGRQAIKTSLGNDTDRATTTTTRAAKRPLSVPVPAASTSSRDRTARGADDAPSEPDPSAIIDWLLKDGSEATRISH